MNKQPETLTETERERMRVAVAAMSLCLYDGEVVLDRRPIEDAVEAIVAARLAEVRGVGGCAGKCILTARTVEDPDLRLPWLDEL